MVSSSLFFFISVVRNCVHKNKATSLNDTYSRSDGGDDDVDGMMILRHV